MISFTRMLSGECLNVSQNSNGHKKFFWLNSNAIWLKEKCLDLSFFFAANLLWEDWERRKNEKFLSNAVVKRVLCNFRLPLDIKCVNTSNFSEILTGLLFFNPPFSEDSQSGEELKSFLKLLVANHRKNLNCYINTMAIIKLIERNLFAESIFCYPLSF